MISSSTLPENVHIKNEIVSDESTQYVDYYIKDDNTEIKDCFYLEDTDTKM